MSPRPSITSSKGPENGWSVVKQVAPYLWPKGNRPARVRVILALLVMISAKVISVTAPYLYKLAVDVLSGDVADKPEMMLVFGAVGLTVAYGFARLMTNGFQQLRDAIFAPVGQAALRQLALQTFQHIHALSLRYHLTRKTGGLSRIIERGVKGVAFLLNVMLFGVFPLILELSMVLIILWRAFGFSYLSVVAITIAAYVMYTFKVTEWRVKIRKEMNDQDNDANQKAVDSLLNYETVKYFNADAREIARYDTAMAAYEKAAVKTEYSLAFLNFGQSVFITSGLVSVMVMAAMGVQNGTMSVGDFVMVNAYMIQITMPLNFLGSMYRNIRQSLVDMEEMFGLLEQPAEVVDAPDAKPLNVSGGALEFKNVDFAYDAERPILRGLDLSVPAGKKVAVVGPSGAGKSTIGRMLFRFYDISGGSLLIDGQDVRDVTQTSLHAAIGVVPQDTVLFNDTVRYNIAYGKDNATFDEIVAASKKAQIHDFILSLPNGYETQVGERGLKLSGGEKQRVGIARTLLKDPPILLLDEATSALDTQTERDILGALKAAGEGRTVITIAHRLSTVADADEIVVLEKGQVTERGTHEELLERHGKYSAMWAAQAEDREDVA
ncbi:MULTISPECIES: ABCB family ABC transporter ATP-binding protein/permease [Pacificibacter]|uniref:ABCB family ABC transporter ATP-binding protein/permease n=1 Tax=Pacificibacter TaxID=1042323 RepID=UPI001C0855C5|nr:MULTISPECIES: ABC transporter ATP-binding protein/permease [Pacificibacter]MBU2936901.1 ABC transporter ATP-binding protein/permease [Pacificibacter marinus]MDO6614895.1 ABC transporter ATP-binding protein/permease [Pacificibacter sp. 1_MG-2023]